MPSYTSNFSMLKPLATETYNISQTNNNMDIVDTRMNTNRNDIRMEAIYRLAQASMSGGGRIKWTTDYRLHWSSAINMRPVDKSINTSGYYSVPMPANGTNIAGLGGASGTTVNTSGVSIPVGYALIACLESSANPILKLASAGTSGKSFLSMHVIIAVNDDGVLKMNNGYVIPPGGEVLDGKLAPKLSDVFVTGSYTGDDKTPRLINIGFEPSAVFIATNAGRISYSERNDTFLMTLGGLVLRGMPMKFENSIASYNVCEIVPTGFKMTTHTVLLSGITYHGRCNWLGHTYHYIAYR